MSLGINKFKIVRGFLQGELLEFLGLYAFNNASRPDAIPTKETRGFVDDQIPNTPAWHNDPVMWNLMCYLCPDVEKYTGKKLIAAYSYLRVYKKGDELKRHIDRSACEFSVTLTLKRHPSDDIWPIYLESDKIYRVSLEAGDGLIYKGTESPHWRDKFEGEKLAQVFLHYVSQ